jgi:hypothetical protein
MLTLPFHPERTMLDLAFVAGLLLFFAIFYVFSDACERL